CEERISRPPAVGVEVLELDDLHSVPRGRADLSAPPAGLTRGSIFLEELKVHSRKGMDCRVKPGNDRHSASGTPPKCTSRADNAHKIVPWFAGDTNRSTELGRHAISPTRPA